MKVLHIHYTDWVARSGGGVVAMDRLHGGLKTAGVDSKVMAKISSPEAADSVRMPTSTLLTAAEKLLAKAAHPLGFNDIHCVNSFALPRSPEFQEADILHFHGLQGGYFSYLALPSLTRNKIGVLTLHDTWAFTGHCAYFYDCERWKAGCGKCPYPEASPAIRRDNTYLEWKLKNWTYGRSNLAVVTLSRRLTSQVKQSMLARHPLYEIPHGIDTDVYRPLDKRICRSALGIPEDKYVLLFAAAKLYQRNKGTDILIRAVNGLPDALRSNVVLAVLGDRSDTLRSRVNANVVDLGFASGDRMKVLSFSAADLFVYPTRAETFGLVIEESMACGTPVVSFDVGGVPDLVRHGLTGYLAQPEDVDAFRAGIVVLLRNHAMRQRLSRQSRETVVREYSLDLQIARHIRMYRELADRARERTGSASGAHVAAEVC